MGRVEKAYLLVDAASENVHTVLNHIAGVTLSDFWYVLIVDLSSFQVLAINFVNPLLGDSGVVAAVHEQLAFVYHCGMTPSLAGVPCPPRSLCPL